MDRNFFIAVFGRRFGFQYSPLIVEGERYMDRFILYCGVGTLRLHRFFRGDDARAPHTHPWKTWWTFPFCSYFEVVENPYYPIRGVYLVDRFKWHKRKASYRHIVIGRADGLKKPFWTFVVTGPATNKWGFYPEHDIFVPWREWG